MALSDWEGSRKSGGRVGQRPEWLKSPGKKGGERVREVSHSQMFAAGSEKRESRKSWEKRIRESLPTFSR